MAHRCDISGKDRQHGHRVSHANNKRKHVFKGNIQDRKVWLAEAGKFVRLKLSTKVLKTIDKIGLTQTLKKYNISIKELL
jgi:large subunit ribosomal protein L28